MKFLFLLVFISLPSFAMLVKDGKVILEKLDDYTFCQSKDYSGDWCHRALEEWVEGQRDDAFKAGKLTRLHMNHWGAIPFFEKAMKGSDFDCKDEDVKLATISALNLPASGNGKIISAAKEIAFTKCNAELKEAITAAASLDSYLFKNACGDLQLSGLKKAKCEALKK